MPDPRNYTVRLRRWRKVCEELVTTVSATNEDEAYDLARDLSVFGASEGWQFDYSEVTDSEVEILDASPS